MDELLEAELFSKELDELLEGAPGAASGEFRGELAMAQRLLTSDLSRESRVKKVLAEALDKRAEKVFYPSLFARLMPRPRTLALYGGLATALLAPLVFHLVSTPDEPPQTLTAGFSRAGSPMFGDSSSYEQGAVASMGGMIGAASDVVTPLNVRDPSNKVMSPGYRGAGKRSTKGVNAEFILPGVARPKQPDYLIASASPKDQSLAFVGGRTVVLQRGQLGQDSEVVTPLNARDPSNLVYSGDGLDAESPEPADREGYDRLVENAYQSPADQPLSTFSIDVDKASYANARRFLQAGRLPPPDAVRVEEFINYFRYEYPEPKGEHPLSITTELAACPWNDAHKLVRIGLKGRTVPKASYPAANLVFLIDTSGSMSSPDKLPLLKQALFLLIEQLRPQDEVSIVAYAGAAGLVLPPTSGRDAEAMRRAIAALESGGSTAGGAGIQLAYRTAVANFKKGGNNRVILATDGDFNVGLSSDGELTRLIEEERKKGVFLTVLGFGTGNYQDAKMEKLADTGNGNYAYVDSLDEGRKVLVEEMGGTLLTLAKDVKLQVEFNPTRVKAYRLIGYENRMLKAQDFNDDAKDAGELGSGQTVTALYEVVPPGVEVPGASVDPLKYQKAAAVSAAAAGPELLTVKFRYKDPDGDKSKLQTAVLEDAERPWSRASADMRGAAAAAGFGMLLRRSEFAGSLTFDRVLELTRPWAESDPRGPQAELADLVKRAKLLDSPSLRLKE